MYKMLFVALSVLLLAACGGKDATKDTTNTGTPAAPVEMGAKVDPAGAMPLAELIRKMADSTTAWQQVEIDGGNIVNGIAAKAEGKATEVCQSAGCWLTMKTDDGKEITVMVKDHAFKLPKDLAGKTVVAEGHAYKVVTSVEELRQNAKAKGVSQEKIAEITHGKEEYFLSAKGVYIKP